jgi:hypothetical protein
VIASSSGLADTAVVTLTQALGSGGAGPMGIPFGASQLLNSGASTAPLTMSLDGYSASTIASRIADARTRKIHLLMNLTGGGHTATEDGSGGLLSIIGGVLQFDRAKWNAKMQTYNTSAIKTAVAAAVADGTIVGASVMDEPNVRGQGDGNTWGPVGTMTKARVDSLCGYVKAMFPTLPAGVMAQHDAFEPTKGYRVCDFIIDQFSTRKGDVTAYRDAGLAMAARDHHAILFSLNVLSGGTQDKDGTWDCAGTGGLGTFSPNCRMTAAQVQSYGLVLGPAGCGLNMWRWDSTFVSRTDNRAAFQTIADALAKLPRSGCVR